MFTVSDPRPIARSAHRATGQLAFVDCVRGYAVLLVVASHVVYAYPELPSPVHRLATMGWHGVQLFFLASAMTLLMSWRRDVEGRNVPAFFLRRLFRIAPAYYAAAGLYALLWPPGERFDWVELLANLGFLNGWSPRMMTSLSDGWHVVPGGWSIAVEWTFYLLFPLFATWVTSLRRALALVVACLLAGPALNRLAEPLLAAGYPPTAVENFLYFWFPNQMVVFALGAALYFAWDGLRRGRAAWLAAWLARRGGLAAAVAAAAFFASGFLPLPHRLGQGLLPPGMIVASLCLAGFVLALSQARGSWLTPRPLAIVGQASFSIYLLHFAVIRLLLDAHPVTFHAHATGLAAIAAFAVGWLAVTAISIAAAWLNYQGLERPMMALGKRLVRRLGAAPARSRAMAATA